MKLFDVVPGNFFSILSSVNREVYYDALMVLHNMFKFELNIRMDDYIASLINILEDRAFEIEDDDGVQEGSLTLSGKARLILNRFIKKGFAPAKTALPVRLTPQSCICYPSSPSSIFNVPISKS